MARARPGSVIAAVVAAAAVPLALIAVHAARAGPDWALAGASSAALAVEVAAACALVAAGVVVWTRGPDVPAGALFAAAGLLRLVAEWNNPDGAGAAVIFSVGLALGGAGAAFLAHGLLVFARGRLAGVAEWSSAAVVYLGALMLGLGPALWSDPRVEGCLSCPANLLHLAIAPSAEDASVRAGLALSTVGLTLVAGLVAVRTATAAPARRRLAAPVVIPGTAAIVIAAADLAHAWPRGFVSNDPVDQRWWLLGAIAVACVAAGVAWQRIAARRVRLALARMVVQLADAPRPGALQEALAMRLGDPGLELMHRDTAGWIDARGRPVPARDGAADGRETTSLMRDGHAVAALVHRQGLLDDPRLVGELGRTARLALDHERLQARLQGQLARLRASRARTVAVGDDERRRLERDLHDGAQQGLAGLAMTLGLARATTGAAIEPALLSAQLTVQHALADVRELAHGLYPAELTDAGLAAALDVLAEWMPGVCVAEVSDERFRAAVESTAYFVITALARGTGGPVTVGVLRAGDALRIEVRGPRPPEDLVRQLEDRVGALDGDLIVEPAPPGSDTVTRVWLPCAS